MTAERPSRRATQRKWLSPCDPENSGISRLGVDHIDAGSRRTPKAPKYFEAVFSAAPGGMTTSDRRCPSSMMRTSWCVVSAGSRPVFTWPLRWGISTLTGVSSQSPGRDDDPGYVSGVDRPGREQVNEFLTQRTAPWPPRLVERASICCHVQRQSCGVKRVHQDRRLRICRVTGAACPESAVVLTDYPAPAGRRRARRVDPSRCRSVSNRAGLPPNSFRGSH